MENEITGGVAESKVVASELALLCIKCQLVASEPTLIVNDGGCIDQWSGQVDIDVTIQADTLV